jgi:4-methylaminobutanoate oxidase (formaldehyde-forming)
MQVIGPQEACDLFPLIDPKGVLGAAFIPSDGHVDPASLCQSIAAGARRLGVQIVQGKKVLDAGIADGRITEIQTDDGVLTAETVVLAAGMWSRELGRKLGVNVPACAVEHQYLVTEPIPGMPKDLPTLRDPTASSTTSPMPAGGW